MVSKLIKSKKFQSKKHLSKLVKLLRFGLYSPQPTSRPILNIKTIATTLGLSSYKIKKILN